jgi:hypothetical protein
LKVIILEGYSKVHGDLGFTGYAGFYVKTAKDFIFACR